MKKIFVLTICLFILSAGVNIVHAQDIDAEIRPDLCASGVQVNIDDSNVACVPRGYTVFSTGNRDDQHHVCSFEGWGNSSSGGSVACCPAGWTSAWSGWRSSGNSVSCCPPGFPNHTDDSAYESFCLDSTGNDWDPMALANAAGELDINGTFVPVVIDQGRTGGGIFGNVHVEEFNNFAATHPGSVWINSADEDIYWCPDVNYYCLYRGRGLGQFVDHFGPSFRWEYSDVAVDALSNRYTTSSQTPFNKRPAVEWGANQGRPKCQRTCSSQSNNLCLPQVGWIQRTDTWNTGLNAARMQQDFINPDDGTAIPMNDPTYSSWNAAYSLLCDASGNFKDLIPGAVGRDDATISGCGRIISYRSPDGAVLFRDPGAFPDLYEEYERCQLCQGTIESPTGNLWSEFGCIEPTASGIVNRIFQIAVGIAGGIIIYRILQAVVKLNLEEPTQEREAEIREIFTSIVVFLIVTLGSVVVLRFLVVNLLGFPLPSLFSF